MRFMVTSRLEAFSDGVLAVIITIMVLGLKVPHGATFADLLQVIPGFLVYIFSFVTIGTYWNNHHHLLHVTKVVNAKIMWANLNLLFWLSLIPFFTAWLSEHYHNTFPTAAYGSILLVTACSYILLQRFILAGHDNMSKIKKNIGSDRKGIISLLLYTLAIPLAFIHPYISDIFFAIIALVWFIPDKRLEI